MANIYVTETLTGATFTDGSVLSGTWTAEYTPAGVLLAYIGGSFTLQSADGKSSASWTAATETGTGSTGVSPFLVHPTGSSNLTYGQKLYIDFSSAFSGSATATTPTSTTLIGGTTYGTTPGASTSADINGTTTYLGSVGTVTAAADSVVTSNITGVKFTDGSTGSGSWTAIYDPSGNLVGIQNASFTVSGTDSYGNAISTTFSSGYVLYGSTSSSSFEITFSSQNNFNYGSLYLDYKSEMPTSLYDGTTSQYSSVKKTTANTATTTPTSSTTVSSPYRLASDGSTGAGSLPVISSMPSTLSGTDTAPLHPFAKVTITDPDPTTTTSAVISLNVAGSSSDANGTLSGSGLTETSAGTYALSATTPAALTTELQALTFTPKVAEGASGSTFQSTITLSVNDSDGSSAGSTVLTETATCFLAGTLIATPSGEVAVESLAAGDSVSVLENGVLVSRTVAWAGHGRIDAARFGFRDEAFPVRIRANAFADSVPARDLLVTPEHCVLTEAGLVPARMLVNRLSIHIDRTIPQYAFFHVELDRHGILLSEGLATESYLDTGNRRRFERIGADALQATRDAAAPLMAAPLAVSRDLVEPIWNRLSDRAAALGFESVGAPPVLTDRAELRLQLENGVALSALSADPRRQLFIIPAGARAVRLLSRAATPAQVIGPFVDDRRSLGVQVEKLVLWCGLDDIVLPASDIALAGWHQNENGLRWTDGSAVLDLPVAAETSFIDVHLAGTMLYPQQQAA